MLNQNRVTHFDHVYQASSSNPFSLAEHTRPAYLALSGRYTPYASTRFTNDDDKAGCVLDEAQPARVDSVSVHVISFFYCASCTMCIAGGVCVAEINTIL